MSQYFCCMSAVLAFLECCHLELQKSAHQYYYHCCRLSTSAACSLEDAFLLPLLFFTYTWALTDAQHCLSENALKLFRKMEQLGMKANSVTLLCVLFTCSHGGLVEQGLKYFQEMEQNYGVVPEIEYYACIVDLCGRLNDAMEFIRKMPIEPSEMVWQTLLGTCRVHELGEIAA